MADDVLEAAIAANAQAVSVAGLRRLQHAAGARRGQVRGRPHVAHFAHGTAPYRAGFLVVARRPSGKMERDVFAQIGGRSEQTTRGSEGPLRQGRFLGVASVGLQAITHRALIGGDLGKLESGRIHVQLRQNLGADILLVGHPRRFGDNAAQETEGVVGIFVARVWRRGKRNAAAEPLRQIGVAGAELLIAPRIILRGARCCG